MIRRYSGAFAVAAAVTFGLFFLMQHLVSHGKEALTEGVKSRSIDFVRLKKEEVIHEKKRRLPKKPPPVKPPPPMKMAQTKSLKPSGNGVNISAGNLDVTVDAGEFDVSGAPNDGDILPLVRVPPQYPRRAEAAGIEGYVDLEFDISKTGAVINPRVVEAYPSSIFNRAALRAILKWKYKPRIEDGEAVERVGVQVRISFNLEDG
ncbi:MAG: energy transducer TonB [Sphingomonadales bacterium]